MMKRIPRPIFRKNQPVRWHQQSYQLADGTILNEIEYLDAIANVDNFSDGYVEILDAAELSTDVYRGTIIGLEYPEPEEIDDGVEEQWHYHIRVLSCMNAITGCFDDTPEGLIFFMAESSLSAMMQPPEPRFLKASLIINPPSRPLDFYCDAGRLPLAWLNLMLATQTPEQIVSALKNPTYIDLQEVREFDE